MNFSSRVSRFTITYICSFLASAVLVITCALAFSAPTVYAEDFGLQSTAQKAGLPTGDVGPTTVVANIINIILGLVGVIAVVLILYGGFMWMTSAGNEEKIDTAKKLIASVMIGLVIVLSAYIITSFVVNNLKSASQ